MVTIKWVPLVNHYNICCCSCTLRTGTMIIAWLGLIFEVIQVMDTASRLYFYKEELTEANPLGVRLQEELNLAERHQTEGTTGLMIEDNGSLGTGNGENEAKTVGTLGDEENVGYVSVIESREVLATRLVLGILHLVVHACLLYGAWKEKAQFMVPYVLIQFICVVIFVLIVVLGSIILLFVYPLATILILIIGGPITLLSAYLWAAVYTYYRQLTETGLPHQEGQLQNLAYVKPEEEEGIINPEEIQKAYAKIEYNIQQNQPHAVQ